jgi:hypothetical protein
MFIFGIFVGCGSGGENDRNPNDKEFVFPKQEYIRCYNNESFLLPVRYNEQETSFETSPAIGCFNIIYFRNKREITGEYLFTILANSEKLENIHGEHYKPFYAYRKSDVLVFYQERANLDNVFNLDTLNITSVEQVKTYIYKSDELPTIRTKTEFFNYVNSLIADYILDYVWYGNEINGSYSLVYLRNNFLIFSNKTL